MDKIQELLMDTRNLNILSYDKYKKSSIKEKLEKIKLLNEYYKILYSNINKLDIYFDFDGVIKDTMRHCSYLLLRLHGIDINLHSKFNVEDEKIVENFFKSMDWDYLLNISNEINEAVSFIKLFQESIIFNPAIYSAVNSVSEMHKKCIFIERNIGNIPKKFNAVHTPKLAVNNTDVLVDDTEYNLENWTGVPIHFDNGKDSMYYTIYDFGELYYLANFNSESNNMEINTQRIYTKK